MIDLAEGPGRTADTVTDKITNSGARFARAEVEKTSQAIAAGLKKKRLI